MLFYLAVMVIELVLTVIGMYTNSKMINFFTLVDYLSENNYYTYADAHSEIIIPKLRFNEFNIHNEQEIDLVEWHSKLLEKMNVIYNNGKISFSIFIIVRFTLVLVMKF